MVPVFPTITISIVFICKLLVFLSENKKYFFNNYLCYSCNFITDSTNFSTHILCWNMKAIKMENI